MPIYDAITEIISKEGHNKELTPYLMFKYALKNNITRKYYERGLKNSLTLLDLKWKIKTLNIDIINLQKKQKIIQIW